MRESHIQVARTARYLTLGEPGDLVRELWVVCHGYGQLARRFLSRFRTVEAPHRLIVAPEALQRFYLDELAVPAAERRVGATWMTREDRLADIEDNLGYLSALYDESARLLRGADFSLHVLGFSQGVSTVARWIARGGPRPARLTLWAGGLPAEIDLGLLAPILAQTEITLVLGDADVFASPARLTEMGDRFRVAGLHCREITYAGGHELNAAVLQSIAGDS
jgi:predicted esterase